MRKLNFINIAFIITLTFLVNVNPYVTKEELTLPHCEKIEVQHEVEYLTVQAINNNPKVLIENTPQCQIIFSNISIDKVWKPPITLITIY